MGQCTHLKLGELSSLFIVYNITIFDFIHCIHGFWFYFLLHDNAHTLLSNNIHSMFEGEFISVDRNLSTVSTPTTNSKLFILCISETKRACHSEFLKV